MARRPVDVILLVAVLLLLLLSVYFVFTASSARAERLHQDSMFYLKRQMIRLLLGLLLGFLMMRLDYHHVLRVSPLVYLFSVGLLVALLFAPEAWTIRGSRRWLLLGPVQFQPSELAKYGLIFYLAMNLAKPQLDIRKLGDGLAPQLLLAGVVVVTVALEPDLGTALIIAATVAAMLFLAGARLSHLFALLSSVVLAGLALTARVAYQRGRVEAFVDSLMGHAEPAWQVKQSLIGLGTGGLLGVGLGQSKQKLLFLPDPFTDFILSIIGEELGLIGTLTVVVLFLIILWRGFSIARQAPDAAGRLTAFGITCTIGLGAFVNMSVVTNLLPTTGIPLPFVSYGGTALIMNLIGIGVLLNISTQGSGASRPGRGLAKVPLARVQWYRDRKKSDG